MLDSCKMIEKQSEAFHTFLWHFSKFKTWFYCIRPDCIFESHQLWQSGFSRVNSNCCCSCSFEPEIIKTGRSYYKIYSNNIENFQESSTIWNPCTKKSGNLLKAPRISLSNFFVKYILHYICLGVKNYYLNLDLLFSFFNGMSNFVCFLISKSSLLRRTEWLFKTDQWK